MKQISDFFRNSIRSFKSRFLAYFWTQFVCVRFACAHLLCTAKVHWTFSCHRSPIRVCLLLRSKKSAQKSSISPIKASFERSLFLCFLLLLSAVHGDSTIVIDAGHGGLDLGTRSKFPYCEEKRVALQTARLVKKYLNQLGYHVLMTRTRDVFVPLDQRVEIANKASADLFVSVHYNSSRSPSAQGIEVFFHNSKDNPRRASASHRLAEAVLTRVIRRTQATSRGVKKGNYYVIRETHIPAILIEGGFISNPEERAFLKDPEYIEEIARGVADGIDAYFKKTST